MSNIVIKAEGISKSYLIGHKSNERYTTLRDIMANKVKGLFPRHCKERRAEATEGEMPEGVPSPSGRGQSQYKEREDT